MNRRMFFGRIFSLTAVGITAQITPAIAKIGPVEEVIRDMHTVKHEIDLWTLANMPPKPVFDTYKWYRSSDELMSLIHNGINGVVEKSIDLFPTDPTNEDVRLMFKNSYLNPGNSKMPEPGHPSHITYYQDHDPAVLPIAVAKHMLGVWRLPVDSGALKAWPPFVSRYSKYIRSVYNH